MKDLRSQFEFSRFNCARRLFPRLFVLTFLFLIFSPANAKVTSSNKIFFPAKEGRPLLELQKTPVTWWNFLFYDSSKIQRSKVCDLLSGLDKESILFNPCGNLPVNQQWLNRWSKENLLHSPPPQSLRDVEKKLNHALVQLSLPLPTGQLEILRTNPLADFSKLEAVFSRFFETSEPSTDKWKAIPILFHFPPSKVSKTENLLKSFPTDSSHFHWVGPHIGTYENQQTIIKDVKKVLTTGTLLLGLLFLFLILRGRVAYLLLIPILGISCLFAYLVVHWAWGSIHGLTLAFGSGLIGISMDYAFHGWKTNHDHFLWKTNSIGFTTTFGAFLLLTFFSIPLIRQISFFTSTGLACAFILSFSLSRLMSTRWKIAPLNVPRFNISKTIRLSLLGLFLLLAVFKIPGFHYDFALKKMDHSISLRPEGVSDEDLFNDSSRLGFLPVQANRQEEIISWGRNENLSLLGSHSLFTTRHSEDSLQKWIQWSCPPGQGIKALDNPTFQKIFREFYSFLSCENLQTYRLNDWKSSLNLFKNQNQELLIVKANNKNQYDKIKDRWPQSFFVSDFTKNFSKSMEKDTIQYLIIIFLFVSSLLLIVFQKRFPLVILPTLGAVLGLILLVGFSGRPATFMTFMGLLILLGLTLDYGIFCTAFLKRRKPLDDVFGAVSLSALTSICGFAPLAFCTHPVLRDLGGSIIFGLMGACFVTFIAYPLFEVSGGKKS